MNILDPIFYRMLFYDFCPVISPSLALSVEPPSIYDCSNHPQRKLVQESIWSGNAKDLAENGTNLTKFTRLNP
jgi:hypothetical protein